MTPETTVATLPPQAWRLYATRWHTGRRTRHRPPPCSEGVLSYSASVGATSKNWVSVLRLRSLCWPLQALWPAVAAVVIKALQ
jgi:hypothetical protein